MNSPFAIIIPAFNEASTIQNVVEQSLKQSNIVIVVNDASTDNTAEIVSSTDAILLNHETNKGKANALLSGFTKAIELNVKAAITLDGDGQHDPQNIEDLWSAYQHHQNTLIVAARLEKRENAPRARLMANKIADFWVGWAASQPIADSQSGFRLYPIELLKQLNPSCQNPSGFVFESEVLIEASHKGFELAFIPIESLYPEQRRASHFKPGFDISQITLMVAKKLLKRGLNLPGLFVSTVKKPLILARKNCD